MNTETDFVYLNKALELAKTKRGFCAPNPSVGAVIVSNNQTIMAAGYHEGPGSPHAELKALQQLTMSVANKATMYVTLEPCCHWGRTPPCTDALIQAEIHRVVYGYQDPNPLVNGKSAAILRAAGIQCDFLPTSEIESFYKSYVYWEKNKRPFVTAKIALSLNGVIAGENGERIPITGAALQEWTHFFRRSSDAILTTNATIHFDNPQLNARHLEHVFAKPLYILDSHLQLSADAAIFNTAKSITLFHKPGAYSKSLPLFLQRGVRCIAVDSCAQGLNLDQVMECIGQDGIHDLWVEAGGKCFSSLLSKKCIQRAFIYIAPRWLEGGKKAFDHSIELSSHAQKLHWQQVGNDVLCEIHW